MLIDELIEGDGHLIVVGNSVLSHDDGGQTWQPSVADGIDELVHLLALQQRLEGLAVVVLWVLKSVRRLVKVLENC